ncbi:DNA-binding transcriptional activator PspC [Kordia sp. SMS9]|uniref:PspC domain-containing protein n=1 Tax=Kordia sp. SMS9 TaxID=2282170 RepID=UPI000E0D70BF|nr:PspC domain-containing protein [Kordia sp. SMS9]AXG70417.1 DNA-binding transcriptional activator PspC [Kordia sp. SMS9]
MNKTININLANMFFHIDEDAYKTLQRYLNAIKRSFTDSQGRDEILADIEARVAELFSERMKSERQVVGIKEVEEVIDIMGQPEDYLVDDEIFEDGPKGNYTNQTRTETGTGTTRKLYRDYDNKYIAGVCAGIAQYFGVDALWVRLIAVLIVFAGVGSPIFVYFILWIIIPKATTTSEKLAMAGKPANISNIEKKIKEGLDDVQETINDINFEQVGQKAKSGASSFFDSIGHIITTFIKVFGKFFGVIFIIAAASILISLILSALGISMFDFDIFQGEESIYYEDLGILNQTPPWVLGLLALLVVGIPALVLFIFGIKILVKNSKSIGTSAKIGLVVLWIGACLGVAYIASSAALHQNIEATVSTKEQLSIVKNDTINVKMVKNEDFDGRFQRYDHDYNVEYDENGNIVLYSRSVRLTVKPTENDNARLRVSKNASGVSYQNARQRAQGIEYNYNFDGKTLRLDGFFLFDEEDKYNNQKVEVVLYLPEGAIIYADKNTKSFHRNSRGSGHILARGSEEHYYQVVDDELECLDCPSTKKSNRKNSTRKQRDAEKTTTNTRNAKDSTAVKNDSISGN